MANRILIRGPGWSLPPIGFYIGILIKSSPPKGGGTQADDFIKGFINGFFEEILRRRNLGGQGDPDPLIVTRIPSKLDENLILCLRMSDKFLGLSYTILRKS